MLRGDNLVYSPDGSKILHAGDRNMRKTEKMIDKIYAESEVKESGYVMPSPHCHPYFELFYIENGVCRFFIKNNMYDMHTGDFT